MSSPLTRLCVAAVLAHGSPVLASESSIAKHAVVAHAEIGKRTAVIVSSELLHFHVGHDGQPAEVSITYRAGARTTASGDVRLSVSTVAGPADSAVIALTVDGETDEVGPATLTSGNSTIAARWTGGGVREGRLRFQLRAAPGTYVIPVAFRLTAP